MENLLKLDTSLNGFFPKRTNILNFVTVTFVICKHIRFWKVKYVPFSNGIPGYSISKFLVMIICLTPAVVLGAFLPQALSLLHSLDALGTLEDTPVQQQPVNQTRPSSAARNTSSISLCTSFTNWRDLGNQSFPRFVKEKVCGGERCFDGNHRCLPVYYTMSVLTQRMSQRQPEDDDLPETLRNGWRFGNINISIGCTCGL